MPSEDSDAKPSRRAFLIRYAGAAFAAPVIASFALDGVAQAGEKHKHHHGHSNQCCPNQALSNQCLGDQAGTA